MKTRTSLVSNSSSSSFIICNAELIKIDNLNIDENDLMDGETIESTRRRIENILEHLKEEGSFDTEAGYSDDYYAFSCITNYITEHEEKFLIKEIECGADAIAWLVNVTKDQIDRKRKYRSMKENTESHFAAHNKFINTIAKIK